jgi:hypothetical protein
LAEWGIANLGSIPKADNGQTEWKKENSFSNQLMSNNLLEKY